MRESYESIACGWKKKIKKYTHKQTLFDIKSNRSESYTRKITREERDTWFSNTYSKKYTKGEKTLRVYAQFDTIRYSVSFCLLRCFHIQIMRNVFERMSSVLCNYTSYTQHRTRSNNHSIYKSSKLNKTNTRSEREIFYSISRSSSDRIVSYRQLLRFVCILESMWRLLCDQTLIRYWFAD